MSFYENKNVLVTGGTGLIGQPLVRRLLDAGAKVTVVSLDDEERCPDGAKFIRDDLRNFETCLDVCKQKEIVFQLAGIKGSPMMMARRPASLFVPTLQFSINMMEAARQNNVEHFLFTSSIGVYAPSEKFREDDVWSTFPSSNDKFAGWAKRIAELQAEAYRIEYGWDKISIVRPANVYGPYDNFDQDNAMVIPSLISRVSNGEKPLKVWGDGSPVRDFIHADDVARGMMLVVKKGVNLPVNLGSGDGVSISRIANVIVDNFPGEKVHIKWDPSQPTGDKKRLMDMERAHSIGFRPQIDIEDGVRETIEWFLNNQDIVNSRYNTFTEKVYL